MAVDLKDSRKIVKVVGTKNRPVQSSVSHQINVVIP